MARNSRQRAVRRAANHIRRTAYYAKAHPRHPKSDDRYVTRKVGDEDPVSFPAPA